MWFCCNATIHPAGISLFCLRLTTCKISNQQISWWEDAKIWYIGALMIRMVDVDDKNQLWSTLTNACQSGEYVWSSISQSHDCHSSNVLRQPGNKTFACKFHFVENTWGSLRWFRWRDRNSRLQLRPSWWKAPQARWHTKPPWTMDNQLSLSLLKSKLWYIKKYCHVIAFISQR